MPVAAAANALVTLDEVRVFGGAEFSDDQLQAVINALSQSVIDECGREFAEKTFAEGSPQRLQGSGSPYLLLPHYPITAVAKVWIDDVELDPAVKAYELIDELLELGMLYRRCGWPAAVPATAGLVPYPETDWADYTIKVAYTGGYAEIPWNLKLAVINECLAAFERPDGRIKSERTPGGYAVTYASSPSLWSPETMEVINFYRVRML